MQSNTVFAKKIEGGTVKISTFQDERFNVITIEDDGVGFDDELLNSKEKEQSVGLKNIKFRLREIAHADIQIDSQCNKGTKVTVLLNREGV